MSKVKQKGSKAGVRNVKAGKKLGRRAATPKARAGAKPKTRAKAASHPSPRRPKPKAKASTTPARKATGKAKSKLVTKLAPVSRFVIKPLDPLRMCGAGTSVQFLYRVDESVEGRTTPHLVYFDHHGWYCDHGQGCPAVAQARKHNS